MLVTLELCIHSNIFDTLKYSSLILVIDQDRRVKSVNTLEITISYVSDTYNLPSQVDTISLHRPNIDDTVSAAPVHISMRILLEEITHVMRLCAVLNKYPDRGRRARALHQLTKGGALFAFPYKIDRNLLTLHCSKLGNIIIYKLVFSLHLGRMRTTFCCPV